MAQQKPLHTMSGDELLALWRDRRGEASQEELYEILQNMEDAEVEAGNMTVNNMLFPGQLSGGGYASKDVEKMDQSIRYLKRKLEKCNNEAEKAKLEKDIDDTEAAKTAKKNAVLKQRHNETMGKLTDIEKLILNPLEGALRDSDGTERCIPELKAFVVARRKQEDLLLANMEKQAADAVKQEILDAKRKHDLNMEALKDKDKARKAGCKAETDKAKAAVDKAKADAEKEKAASAKAAADAEKAAADAEKEEAAASKATAIASKAAADAEKEKAAASKAAADVEKANLKKEADLKREKKEKKKKRKAQKEKEANGDSDE